MFISSEIVKWKLGTWEVVDRIPIYYSVGHLMIPGGDSKKPWGKYLVAMNKITKDRYLPTGPELAQSAQLIDISGDKMKLLLDFPTIGEPHYAQALPAEHDPGQAGEVLQARREHATRAWSTPRAKAGITRNGKRVRHQDDRHPQPLRAGQHRGRAGSATRSTSTSPTSSRTGTSCTASRCWALRTSELIMQPGRDAHAQVGAASAPGVYPFYCTDFCSALHQEMQGYIRVSPPGSSVAADGEHQPEGAGADGAHERTCCGRRRARRRRARRHGARKQVGLRLPVDSRDRSR